MHWHNLLFFFGKTYLLFVRLLILYLSVISPFREFLLFTSLPRIVNYHGPLSLLGSNFILATYHLSNHNIF